MGEIPTTTFTVTDITLSQTGGSLTAQSGTGIAVVLLGIAALAIARRPRTA